MVDVHSDDPLLSIDPSNDEGDTLADKLDYNIVCSLRVTEKADSKDYTTKLRAQKYVCEHDTEVLTFIGYV